MRHSILLVGILLSGMDAPLFAEDTPPADSATTGSWQMHEYTFTFTGINAAYSCDWLAEKLRLLLNRAGARADIKIHTRCQEPRGPSPGAEAHLGFFALVPATGAGDTSAVWHKVVLRDHMPLAIEASDCDLVEQFRVELLPLFTTRAIENRMSCRGVDNDAVGLNLQFEALMPAGKAGD